MSISFGSINTGLPKDIVQQIMKAEAMPLAAMDRRKGKIQAKADLLGQLITLTENMKGEILKNKSARSLRELKVATNDDVIGVVADKNIADPASHQIEVLQLARKSSAITNGVEDKDKTNVGVGYISYTLPNGEEKEVYIDKDNSTLSGIAGVINKADMGIKATVVDDGKDKDEPYRLILALDSTGDANKAEFPYFYLVDGEVDLYISEERPAQDAKIKLDGFELEVPENKIKDLIPGVTVDLKKAKPGEEFSIDIKEDSQKVTEKIGGLVESINGVLKFIKQQNSLDEKTDTSMTLGGDSTLQSLESRLRSIIFTPVMTSEGAKRLGDLGVTFTKEGLLQFEANKFEAQVSSNYKVASEILTGMFTADNQKTDGVMDNLSGLVDSVLQRPNGVLQSRRSGLVRNIEQIDRQIGNKQRQLEQKEKNLKDKFARLEETMANIRNQGSGLAGFGSAPNPVQQLG